jgi:micrococcal nuclease
VTAAHAAPVLAVAAVLLAGCGPDNPPAPDPTPPPTVVTPTATPPTATSRPAPFFADCTAARRANAAPLYRGEPGYRLGLDRNRDGMACE